MDQVVRLQVLFYTPHSYFCWAEFCYSLYAFGALTHNLQFCYPLLPVQLGHILYSGILNIHGRLCICYSCACLMYIHKSQNCSQKRTHSQWVLHPRGGDTSHVLNVQGTCLKNGKFGFQVPLTQTGFEHAYLLTTQHSVLINRVGIMKQSSPAEAGLLGSQGRKICKTRMESMNFWVCSLMRWILSWKRAVHVFQPHIPSGVETSISLSQHSSKKVNRVSDCLNHSNTNIKYKI